MSQEHVPEDLYGSWSGSPSPDGSRVALVSDRGGLPQVWVSGPAGLERVEGAPGRATVVSWSPDGVWLACVVPVATSSRTQVWAVRPEGSGLRLLAGAGAGTAELGGGPWRGWSADGRVMLTESRGPGPLLAVLVDPASGRRREVVSAPLTVLLDVSRDFGSGAGRALVRVGPRGARSLAVVDEGGVVVPVDLGPGPGGAERGCLSPDGRVVWARSHTGRDRAALVRAEVDARHAAPVVLAERDGGELEDVVLSPDGTAAALLWNVDGGRSALGLLALDGAGRGQDERQDEGGAAAEERVTDLPRDVVEDCRFTADGKTLLLTAQDWTDPRGVWALDLASRDARSLSAPEDGPRQASQGSTTALVSADDLARPELLRVTSGDGLEVSGWLYRPAGPAPWPAMIHLHGGPESQERPVYNSLFQSLVAAGVAVFAPNVRGSSGFGRAFLAADDRERRHGAIDDVRACAEHLVREGVAAPGRVGVTGRSYGGWLTLAALVWHPELFATGLAVCGMSDMLTFYDRTEPWIAAAAVAEYGDPVDDAALLADLSPLRRIDRLRAPLMLVHGARDTNVPVEESRQLAAALAERGAVHRYLEFPDEGHELLRTPNRVRFVQESVAWVREHLGARMGS